MPGDADLKDDALVSEGADWKDASEQETPTETETESAEDNTERIVFKNLSNGFTALRKRRDSGPSDAIVTVEGTQAFLSHALVNFIDPTSSSGSLVTKSNPKLGKPGMMPLQKPPLELYEKLSAIFAIEYGNTLRHVPYQHFRSGANGLIDSLPVKTFMTRSHGGLVSVPWAEAGAAASSSTDPSEWHNASYCHVYIAACESLEHYRNKVKPSIQAFLSQIDAAAKNGGKDSSSATSSGAQYVIVFVPTGAKANAKTTTDEAPRTTSRMGAALGSRFAAARQRMAREASLESGQTSSANTSMDTSVDPDPEGIDGGGGQQSLTTHLSKVDKELARRFAADFSAGQVCTMSTLLDWSYHDSESDSELQKVEWSAFMKCLAAAIADGFRDRCRRYDEELRQLDALRSPVKSKRSQSGKQFDLGYFFLVKESLAFTYEQMCLPSEALLQYDELRAVLPDVGKNELDESSESSSYSDLVEEEDSSPSVLSLAGDSVGFRKYLRSTIEVAPIAHIIQQYLFARETALLFKMDKSVEVMERCTSFVRTMYAFMRKQIRDDSDTDARAQVERWAFEYCWDVKRACFCYLEDEISQSGSTDDDSERKSGHKVGEDLARCLCDLLDFARFRLMNLGDLSLSENPVREHGKEMLEELRTPWMPWKPQSIQQDDSSRGDQDGLESCKSEDFVETALRSGDAFLSKHLELMTVLQSLYRFSGRQRCAARLGIEIVGLHIRSGNVEKAATTLRMIADVYAKDHWDTCHFFLLFRLATYQRQVSCADEYLDTLVQCFSPRHAVSSPAKALRYLQADLEAVVRSSLVSRARLHATPVFDPLLGLEGVLPTEKSGSFRDLVKHVYSIGQRVSIPLKLSSFLAKEIKVDAVTVDLVSFREYVTAAEESTHVDDDDVFRVLRLEGPITVRPGLNEFTFDWVPMVSGQFVLASTAVHWNGVRFSYTSKELKRPTIRVDVIPSEPAQTIQVTPDYLLPGHEQAVQITFASGTDIVQRGSLRLVCSPGLMLLPPGESDNTEQWCSSCETSLPPCPPGETVVLTAVVKSNQVEQSTSDLGSHALHAMVTTAYRTPHPDGMSATGGEDQSDLFFMKNNMESTVATLGKQALTVEGVEMVPYSLDKAMLNVAIQCNTPGPFLVKRWSLSLPNFLSVAEAGDLNNCLAQSWLHSGERISLAFDCRFEDSGSESSTKPKLLIEGEDECSRSFEEVLQLDIKRLAASRASLPKMDAIPVEISLSSVEGFVGVPIKLSYKIDTRNFTALPGEVRYVLCVDDVDWILSSKAEGVVNCTDASFLVELTAIPARPGIIARYPSLSLHLERNDAIEGSSRLMTVLSETDAFNSLSHPVHTVIAFPLSKQMK